MQYVIKLYRDGIPTGYLADRWGHICLDIQTAVTFRDEVLANGTFRRALAINKKTLKDVTYNIVSVRIVER